MLGAPCLHRTQEKYLEWQTQASGVSTHMSLIKEMVVDRLHDFS
jgi:hypothetical protein